MNSLSVPFSKRETLVGWCYMVFQLLFLGSLLGRLNQYFGSPLPLAILNFTYYATNFLCCWVIFYRFLLRNAKRMTEDLWRNILHVLAAYGLYLLLSMVVARFILALRSDFGNVNDASIASIAQSGFLWMSIGTVLLVPVTEELLFRGLIFRQLHTRSRFAAYAGSTFLFAMVHIVAYIGIYDAGLLCLCFLQYLPAGICLGWAYEKTDSIFGSILMHTIVNLVGMLAMR
jgi:membrane protease YdiL (CAAX protease family)